jgi:hypothetical protein
MHLPDSERRSPSTPTPASAGGPWPGHMPAQATRRNRRVSGQQRQVRPVDHRLLRTVRGSERAGLRGIHQGHPKRKPGRQHALDHASSDTTALYDHTEDSLTSDPAHLAAATFSRNSPPRALNTGVTCWGLLISPVRHPFTNRARRSTVCFARSVGRCAWRCLLVVCLIHPDAGNEAGGGCDGGDREARR